ncbi:MAG: phosphatidylglycerophosphatase A [Shewanellaceae bacterium]|nr:phosphatidylglycerophosphatase A [Shewanellaceae bacterium]
MTEEQLELEKPAFAAGKSASQPSVLTKLSLAEPIDLIALGFGSGLAPKAPGTFGTLAALPLVALMNVLTWPWYLMWTVIAFVLGVYICERAANKLGVHDHPAIVWDEFVGLMIAGIGLPLGLFWILLAFAAFRFFDILKPWPISFLDKRVAGGLGIMVDDVAAGFFALGVVQGTHFAVNSLDRSISLF